jgi:uncharacterized protein (TIGR02217 family)
MAFHDDATFPEDISYASSGGPGYRTNILEQDSGDETRVVRRTSARHRFDVAYGIKTYLQLSAVKEFYIARQGTGYGFRYKDFLDCNSTTEGHDINNPDAIAFDDIVVGVGDGADTEWPLIKKYTDGGVTRSRNIVKPRAGVLIGVDGVLQTEGVDYTVNYTTGFEFDVPVRFGDDIDQLFQMTAEDFGSGFADSIPLIELIDDVERPEEFFYGGAYNIGSMSVDTTIGLSNGRVVVCDPQSSGLSLNLPDNTSLPSGGPYFYVYNDSATYAVNIRDSSGSFLFSVPVGSFSIIVLVGTTWHEGVL